MMAQNDSQKGTLIAVAVIIAGGIVAGLLLGRGDGESAVVRVQDVPAPVNALHSGVAPPASAHAATPAVPAVAALSEVEFAQLAEESMSGPAALRVAAIERLSKAPRDQALPLLKRVLLNGDPAVDRPAALLGLRELALSQGDANGRIRDAVREVIYHGDDASLATDAQETLDIIAESESK
jgi:hypothetical protein